MKRIFLETLLPAVILLCGCEETDIYHNCQQYESDPRLSCNYGNNIIKRQIKNSMEGRDWQIINLQGLFKEHIDSFFIVSGTLPVKSIQKLINCEYNSFYEARIVLISNNRVIYEESFWAPSNVFFYGEMYSNLPLTCDDYQIMIERRPYGIDGYLIRVGKFNYSCDSYSYNLKVRGVKKRLPIHKLERFYNHKVKSYIKRESSVSTDFKVDLNRITTQSADSFCVFRHTIVDTVIANIIGVPYDKHDQEIRLLLFKEGRIVYEEPFFSSSRNSFSFAGFDDGCRYSCDENLRYNSHCNVLSK